MNFKRKPDWLKIRLETNGEYQNVKEIVNRHGLHTICQGGDCPNMMECWSRGTATFMILGNICTRACKFCNVDTGKPEPVDLNEPINVAESIKLMKLNTHLGKTINSFCHLPIQKYGLLIMNTEKVLPFLQAVQYWT